ncbi:MAG: hypothetical protein KatS3mg109_0901 [Pirellulaceae bacterium]|nr:MAG: hypothetical protein KatS3mg109_0901 [Pirellulaceae bacterium]
MLHRHGRAERRPEPPGLCRRGQLRSALGHHPAHPARRPRGPHWPAGGEHPVSTRSFQPTAWNASFACARASGQRLQENAEVLGTDEAFFEGELPDSASLTCITRKAGILDGEAEDRKWTSPPTPTRSGRTRLTADPTLQKTIPEMPPVVFATKAHHATDKEPSGVLVYLAHRRGQRRPRLDRPRR